MFEYEANNYGMGRKVRTLTFRAYSDDEARRIAERQIPGANGLPGTSPQAAAKSQIIGLRKTGRS